MGHRVCGGIIVPLLTPLNADETVNYAQLEALIEHVIEGGVNAVFVMGSTGEFARFDETTRANIIKESVKIVSGRIPVYAGVSDTGLSSVLRNVGHAERAGVDAVVVTLPYYFPIYNDNEAYSFFSTVAASTKLSVVLYEIPTNCGASISFDVIDRLFDIDNIASIKDSSGSFERLQKIIERYKNKGKDFSITVGDESLCYAGFMAGADGIVPSLANPFPKLLADAYSAAASSDWTRLRGVCDIIDSMNALNKYNNTWMMPNTWRKKALSHMGICNEYMTKPTVPVDGVLDAKILGMIRLYQGMYS